MGKADSMLRRRWLEGLLVMLVGTASVAAQTAKATGTTAPPAQSANSAGNQSGNQTGNQSRDPIDVKLQDALRERDAIIRNLLERVSELEWRLNGGFTSPAKPDEKPVLTASSLRGAVTAVNPAVPSVVNATYDTTERQATEALDQALIVRGGLLLPSGTLEIDNTASYFSASSDHVTINGFALLPVLVVGDIASQRTRQDYLLPTLTTRLGLPHRFQMDFVAPYGYELIRSVDANNNQTSSSSFGLGDISAGLSRQLTTERGKWPDMLGSVRFKSTTGRDSFSLTSSEVALGTGFNALQGNLTMAKSSDPVVFFGNLSYTANLAADHTVPVNDPNNPGATTVGHFNPGDAVGFSLGSILALNPEVSMTLGWDQRFTRATQLNGVDVPASYLVEGTLRLGTSYVYAPGRTVDLSFGVGLTPDTPNLQFSVGFPFRRTLWGPRPHKSVTK
jgi:hypothetical protein